MRVLRIYHSGVTCEDRTRDEYLQALGIDILCLVPTEFSGKTFEACSHVNLKLISLPIRNSKSINLHFFKSRKELISIIRGFRPDIIDIHEEPYSLVSFQIISVTPPEIPIVHYAAQNIVKFLPPPFNLIRRLAYKRAKAFYPCSQLAANNLRATGFEGAMSIIPLGFNERVFKPNPRGTDRSVMRVSYLGRLIPEKGIRDLALMVSDLSWHQTVELHIIGSGRYQGKLMKILEKNKFRGEIVLHGWTSQARAAKLLSNSHFLIAPSRTTFNWKEQFGRMIIEAQASGTVVATYNSGSIVEICRESALIVDEGNWKVLSQQIQELWLDSYRYNFLVNLSLENARNYTWSAVASKQKQFYQETFKGTSSGYGENRQTTLSNNLANRILGISILGKFITKIKVLTGYL